MNIKESGFTLLELIIVLLLSLLILGLVTIYFANLLSSVKLQATAFRWSAFVFAETFLVSTGRGVIGAVLVPGVAAEVTVG